MNVAIWIRQKNIDILFFVIRFTRGVSAHCSAENETYFGGTLRNEK